MARIQRRREADHEGTWRQALVFNSLLMVLAVLAVRILVSAYTAESVGDIEDVQAREETRREIDGAFAAIVPADVEARTFWASQIARELSERDFSAARGYLLAAPVILDRDDRRALLAAAEAEETGTPDERLARAGLLFLPNNVRADYEKAIERPNLPVSPNTPSGPVDDNQADAVETRPAPDALDATRSDSGPAGVDAERANRFSLVGDRTDLVRRSQRWINNETIDTTQLRLGAIGLVEMQRPDPDLDIPVAISVLRAAARSNRLNAAYGDYLENRVNLAMPGPITRGNVRTAASGLNQVDKRQGEVLAAYERSIDEEGLARLERDLGAVANIARHTSPSGAVTLVELARTPEDMKKLELVSQSGNDRAVALAKQMGYPVTGLAQIGVKWSVGLTMQILALIALFIALGWTTVSALGRIRATYRRWA